MQYAIIETEILKEIYPFWENCRKSNDGTKCIIHKEILDKYRPNVNNLMLEEEEPPYPFPLATGDEINNMEEFKSKDDNIQ